MYNYLVVLQCPHLMPTLNFKNYMAHDFGVSSFVFSFNLDFTEICRIKFSQIVSETMNICVNRGRSLERYKTSYLNHNGDLAHYSLETKLTVNILD